MELTTELYSGHLTRYPECLILELLSTENYGQNIQKIYWHVLENCWVLEGIAWLLSIIVLLLFAHYLQFVSYFYVQNRRITDLFMGV